MDYVSLIFIAIGLSMDAFAVAICNGMAMKSVKVRHAVAFGLMFGGMQAIMPIIGYFVGSLVSGYIESFAYWIAFILLALIGGKMLLDAFRGKEEDSIKDGQFISLAALFALGVATSIDALVVGINFALIEWNIWISALVIGVVTFTLSFAGVYAGKKLGMALQKYATILGGVVLIAIGLKILLQHLFF